MTGLAIGAGGMIGAAFGGWGCVAVAMAVLLAALLRSEPRIVAAGVLALAAALLGVWRLDAGHGQTSVAHAVKAPIGEGRVVTDPVRADAGQRFVVATYDADPSDGQPAMRMCALAGVAPIIGLGDEILISGEVEPAADAATGVRAVMAARGCEASVYAESLLVVRTGSGPARWLANARFRIGVTLRAAAPGDAGVLLSGLVTGDDAGFSPGRLTAFRRTGTTHLTAVSGANLALVAGLLATIGAATVGRHRLPWQSLTIAGVWAYAAVSGFQSPAVRAAIVATAAILAFRFGRRPDFSTLIVLAAGLMAVVDPAQVDALGFRLSVASSLALAVVLPALIRHDRFAGLAAVIGASVAAQIATLPLLLPVFGSISLVSLPANILVAPLVMVAMPLAAIAGVLGSVWPAVAGVVAAPAVFAADATLAVVDGLGTSGAAVAVGTPPIEALTAIGVACVLLLAVLSLDGAWADLGSRWLMADQHQDNRRPRRLRAPGKPAARDDGLQARHAAAAPSGEAVSADVAVGPLTEKPSAPLSSLRE